MTILLLFYCLDSYLDGSALNPAVSDDAKADFQTTRDGRVKAVLRFAYANYDPNDPTDVGRCHGARA